MQTQVNIHCGINDWTYKRHTSFITTIGEQVRLNNKSHDVINVFHCPKEQFHMHRENVQLTSESEDEKRI